MDTEELKTVAAIMGPMVAAASLGLNVFLAWLLRTRTPNVSRIQDVRDAIRAMLGQFDSSRIFTISPHNEVWDMGFNSLASIRATFANSNTIIRYARPKLVNDNIRDIVHNILVETQNVYSFKDSFVLIRRGRENVPYDDIMKTWPQKPTAEAALTALQTYVKQNRRVLKEFLQRL